MDMTVWNSALSRRFVCVWHYFSYTSPGEDALDDSSDLEEDRAMEATVALLAGNLTWLYEYKRLLSRVPDA